MPGEIERFRRRSNQLRMDQDGFSAMAAGPTRCSGQFLLDGMGEAEVQVSFPVKFSQKPLLSFAAEIRDGDMLITTQMPTVSMVVLRWIIEDRPPYSNMYTGAVLGIVTEGPVGSRVFVIWHMDGIAFSNPV